MKPLFCALCLYSLALPLWSAEGEPNVSVQARIAPKLIELIADAPEVELLSLEPTMKRGKEGKSLAPPAGSIEGRVIIGRATIKEKAQISALAAALGTGIGASDGKTSPCFEPLHALRVIRAQGDILIVVSFSCLQGYTKGFPDLPAFSTTASPEKEWDAIFKKYGLPRAR